MVTAVDAPTADVVTGNVALAAPAATLTLAGVAATAVLLLDSETAAPPAGAADVNVTVPCAPDPPATLDGLTLIAFSAAGPAVVRCGRTPTQSRKKSRDVDPATLITRRRKLASAMLDCVHVRPHVSVAPPRVKVARLVPRVLVAFAAVHVAPPSQESCTHIRGEPDALSARALTRTSIPATAEPSGMAMPKL